MVTIERDSDGTLYLKVTLTSRNRPELSVTGRVEIDRKNVLNMVSIQGGACAEHLNERYKDTFDPSTCAKEAREQGLEQFRRMGDLSNRWKGTPPTVPPGLDAKKAQLAFAILSAFRRTGVVTPREYDVFQELRSPLH